MDLLRIAARVAAEQTTAGPTLDIFKDLSGQTVEKAINGELKLHDDGESFQALIGAVRDVYGQEMADVVQQGAEGIGDAVAVVHELMHKVADPGFILGDLSGVPALEEQTSKSIIESTVDEMLIQFLERDRVDDFDNIFTSIRDRFDSVDQVLTELDKGAPHPALDRVLKGAASDIRRNHKELSGKGVEDQVPYEVHGQEGRTVPATTIALWTVQAYVRKKLPQLAETMIAAPAEAKFKKWVNLALSRLRKLGRASP